MMKKIICLVLSICLLLSCSAVAWATDDGTTTESFAGGYYIKSVPQGLKLKMLPATGAAAITEAKMIKVGNSFYPAYAESERIQIVFDSTPAAGQYLTLLCKEQEDGGFPKAGSDIYYINQYAQDGDFTLYPSTVSEATEMDLFITSNVADMKTVEIGYLPAGDYTVQQFEYGKVNSDDVVDNKDASLVLQYSVHTATLTPTQFAAADVNRDTIVDVKDSSAILQYVVHTILDFSVLWNK